MRIGFSSIYSWRPHVEHLYFLATLARTAGHDCFFLTCDSDLPTCYTREIRDIRPDWQECLACRIGGVRSFTGKGVSSLGAFSSSHHSGKIAGAFDWGLSSASTLGRFESDSDFSSAEFFALAKRLEPAASKAYTAAKEWIRRNELDALCVFNGRMDATRAVFEAARDSGIRVVSLERSWLGDGLQLLPDENCLGLKSIDQLMLEWRDRPLTAKQALKAASYAAARFARRNQKEWRAYNTKALAAEWPVGSARRKILLLPSSRNEVWGHPDWKSQWTEPTAAYEAIMVRLGLTANDVVLRCHPNWAEKIGKNDGHRPERYYTEWARQRGIFLIPAASSVSTMSLIEQCDAIVVSGGSAALEAGILGKQVIATDPSVYQQAGFRTDVTSQDRLQHLSLHADFDTQSQRAAAEHIARMTLRFCYTMAHRVAQFTDFVKARSASNYDYYEGADPARLTELMRNGALLADHGEYAEDGTQEDRVLKIIAARVWDDLIESSDEHPATARHAVRRRVPFRPIDRIRQWMPVGDR